MCHYRGFGWRVISEGKETDGHPYSPYDHIFFGYYMFLLSTITFLLMFFLIVFNKIQIFFYLCFMQNIKAFEAAFSSLEAIVLEVKIESCTKQHFFYHLLCEISLTSLVANDKYWKEYRFMTKNV